MNNEPKGKAKSWEDIEKMIISKQTFAQNIIRGLKIKVKVWRIAFVVMTAVCILSNAFWVYQILK